MRTLPVTVSTAFVRGILSGIRADEASSSDWLLRAGIAPGLLHQDCARVTAEQYVALFSVLMSARDDEALGFFTRPLRHGATALAMRSALSASTVESGVRRLCRALTLLQDDMAFSTVREGDMTGVRILVPESYRPERMFAAEFLVHVLARLTVWLHGGRLRPLGVDFPYPGPPHAQEYPKLFPGRIRFDQEHATVWFDGPRLLGPVRRDDAALRAFLHRWPRDLVIPQRHGDSTSERIRAHLQQARPQWPGLVPTAAALNMSVSTLQRHLAEEGSSFQTVKDQLRRDLAIVRLNTSMVTLAALAAELGFSDQAVFQRAFKSWTGSAPGAYRQRA